MINQQITLQISFVTKTILKLIILQHSKVLTLCNGTSYVCHLNCICHNLMGVMFWLVFVCLFTWLLVA